MPARVRPPPRRGSARRGPRGPPLAAGRDRPRSRAGRSIPASPGSAAHTGPRPGHRRISRTSSMTRSREVRQSSRTMPNLRRIAAQSSTPFAGRPALAGNPDVDWGASSQSPSPYRSRIAAANSYQLHRPPAVRVVGAEALAHPRGPATRARARIWTVAEATERVHVGAPNWSLTTEIGRPASTRSSMVMRKLFPRPP